jgi:hypothetical protein
MTLSEFIRENEPTIDDFITGVVGETASIDYCERENWVMNDEGLYTWALDLGVEEI